MTDTNFIESFDPTSHLYNKSIEPNITISDDDEDIESVINYGDTSNIDEEILFLADDPDTLIQRSARKDPTISTPKVIFKPTVKQDEFITAALSGNYTFLCYGGAIRGGKTFVTLGLFILLCKIYPKSRWLIARATNDELTKNVLPSFNKLVPSNFLSNFNSTTKTATFANGSQIFFMAESSDTDPEMERFKGMEINGCGLEEADGMREVFFDKMIERSGSWLMEKMPPIIITLTCNPSQGWVKNKFYTPWEKKILQPPYFYLPAYITDNPYIPQSYLDSLKNLPPVTYKKFVEGSWDASDDSSQLITWDKLTKAKERQFTAISDGPYSLGVDPARYGKDRCVFYVMKGFRVVECRVVGKTDIPEVANITKELIQAYNINTDMVFMDVVGLGGGAYDILHREGYFIQAVSGGGKPLQEARTSDHGWSYYNLNSQIGWYTKLYFDQELICGELDDELLTELAANRYTFSSEKSIRVLSKDDVKKILGRSPDKGDAFKYSLWGQITQLISSQPSVG